MLLTLCDRRYRRSGTVWEGGASGGISLVEYRSNALGEIDYCIGVSRRASAEFLRMMNRSDNDNGSSRVIHAFSEKILSESALFTLEHICK